MLRAIPTPGEGNNCLYYAALLSSGRPATTSGALNLKREVHARVQAEIDQHGSSNSLQESLSVTEPSSTALATDAVLHALADVFEQTVRIHEGNSFVDVDGYKQVYPGLLHIGYTVNHFFGMV